ncbi:hypothetical protein A2U01_0066605, partial [Trifolium medium]|nr:hypothetical protein [Trifolium medium]
VDVDDHGRGSWESFLFYARSRKYFLDDEFVPALPFCACQFGQDVGSCVVSSRDVLDFGGVKLSYFLLYQA